MWENMRDAKKYLSCRKRNHMNALLFSCVRIGFVLILDVPQQALDSLRERDPGQGHVL